MALRLVENPETQKVAGFASRQEDAGQVIQEKRTMLFFKSKTPVTLWKSSLTNVINRQDVLGTSRFSGRRIAASGGACSGPAARPGIEGQ